jgi:hypothetical protein
MYPLLFALLPGTIQAVYTQLLTKLKTYMADIQLFMNFETAAPDQCVEVWVPMGNFLLQFVVPTLDVIYGNGYICVEVVPYSSVTVDPLGYNIVRGTIRPKAKRYRDIYSRLIQLKDRPTSGRIGSLLKYSRLMKETLNTITYFINISYI